MEREDKSLTVRGNGILNVIQTKVSICLPFLNKQPKDVNIHDFVGIWDTGATSSVITKKVAEKVGLKPIAVAEVHHADGVSNSNVYLVNIALPSQVMIQGVKVTEGKLPRDVEVLIGMDVITLGDFSITNHNQHTVMSFRIPSRHEIDYVQEFREKFMNRQQRRAAIVRDKKIHKT